MALSCAACDTHQDKGPCATAPGFRSSYSCATMRTSKCAGYDKNGCVAAEDCCVCGGGEPKEPPAPVTPAPCALATGNSGCILCGQACPINCFFKSILFIEKECNAGGYTEACITTATATFVKGANSDACFAPWAGDNTKQMIVERVVRYAIERFQKDMKDSRDGTGGVQPVGGYMAYGGTQVPADYLNDRTSEGYCGHCQAADAAAVEEATQLIQKKRQKADDLLSLLDTEHGEKGK